jgi:biotin synthase
MFMNNAATTCINLLQHYPDGCKANCFYCGQSRDIPQKSTEKTLIRVDWPLRPFDEVAGRIVKHQDEIYRVCVAQLVNFRATRDMIDMIRRLRQLGVPEHVGISALYSPTITSKQHLVECRDAGADRADAAIDVVSRRLFDTIRGRDAKSPHRFERYVEGIQECVEVFGKGCDGGGGGCHVIAGLGETEKEMIDFMFQVHRIGASIHLFMFNPEESTPMHDCSQPSIASYRRTQIAAYLIDAGQVSPKDFTFNDNGKMTELKFDMGDSSLDLGHAFVTSGCPGCNRPYANERPSQRLRNYPTHPTVEKTYMLLRQTRIPEISALAEQHFRS